MTPLLKRLLKYGFYAAWGGFALLGLLMLPNVVNAINKMDMEPACYFGEAACHKSKVCAPLPLPEQADAQNFPMAVDDVRFFGRSGRVVFRADAAWQEAFRRFYPFAARESSDSSAWQHPDKPVAFAFPDAKGEEKRITDFIERHEWYPFHEGELQQGRLHFFALRDKSGEFIFLYVYD